MKHRSLVIKKGIVLLFIPILLPWFISAQEQSMTNGVFTPVSIGLIIAIYVAVFCAWMLYIHRDKTSLTDIKADVRNVKTDIANLAEKLDKLDKLDETNALLRQLIERLDKYERNNPNK